MKKLIALFAIFLMSGTLLACQNSEALKIMVPSGSPALSQLYIENNTDDYAVDVVQGVDPLVAAFGSKSHDFIFAPSNLGAKLYQNSPDYIFIASVVFGNYYLVTVSDAAFDLASLDNGEITVFGANSTGDIILRYILSEAGINVTITYVDSVATASSLFIANNSLVILTAEPSLSVLLNSNPGIDIIDLQDEYQALTGEDSYPQAGVFAKSTLKKSVINHFLSDLETSVTSVISDPLAAAQLATSLGYAFGETVLQTAIPNSHLGFLSAQDSKADLEAYFNVIISMNSAQLIGGALPVEDFYYQP